MDYDTKANLTTLLATYLVPIVIGYGVSEATANALVGVIVTVVPICFNMLSEMWNSKHLSRPCDSDLEDNEDIDQVEDSADIVVDDNNLLDISGENIDVGILE